MNTTNGKIAIESRSKLTAALFVIMKQYDFKEITVTQITQEAQLSRKTFYRLYSSKEDILNDFFKDLFNEFITTLRHQHIHHYWEVVQLYFDFWEGKRELLNLLKKHNLLMLLGETCYKYAFETFEYVRSKEIMDSFNPYLPYLLSYSLGGIHSMLIKWADEDSAIPSSLLIQNLQAGFQSPDI